MGWGEGGGGGEGGHPENLVRFGGKLARSAGYMQLQNDGGASFTPRNNKNIISMKKYALVERIPRE